MKLSHPTVYRAPRSSWPVLPSDMEKVQTSVIMTPLSDMVFTFFTGGLERGSAYDIRVRPSDCSILFGGLASISRLGLQVDSPTSLVHSIVTSTPRSDWPIETRHTKVLETILLMTTHGELVLSFWTGGLKNGSVYSICIAQEDFPLVLIGIATVMGYRMPTSQAA